MGYTKVRHYHGGIADWKEAGLPIESAPAIGQPLLPAEPQSFSQSMPAGARRARPQHPTVSRSRQWGNSLLDLIESLSPAQIFFVWLGMVVLCGLLYWLTGFSRRPGLVDSGHPIAGTLEGLLSALYFSFVTTTSVGYGDVLPLGPVRILSIFEAVTGLLIFGALVAKFVSRRQDELVRDIYNVTFEARLDRVQTNLHLVLSELQSIAMLCDEGVTQPQRVGCAAGERGVGVRRRAARDPFALVQPATRARRGGAGGASDRARFRAAHAERPPDLPAVGL